MAQFDAVDDDFREEPGVPHGRLFVRGGVEVDGAFAFLAPLYQTALEIDFGGGDVAQVDIPAQYPVDDETVGEIVPLVKIDRSDKGFESVAVEVFVTVRPVKVGDDVLVYSHSGRDVVQGGAADDARAHLCQEPFRLFRIFDKEEVGDDGFQNRIAEEFEPFIVGGVPVRQHDRCGAVYQCEFVEVDVVGSDAQQVVYDGVELPVFAEVFPACPFQIVEHKAVEDEMRRGFPSLPDGEGETFRLRV